LGPESECSTQDSSEDEEGEPGDIGEPDAPRVWCLNLLRVRKLTEFFDERMSRFPMFHRVVDPTKTKEGARVKKYNLVPIRLFFERQDEDICNLNLI